MQETNTKTLNLLLSNNSTAAVRFKENPLQQEQERIEDEIEQAKFYNRPVFFDVNIEEMIVQGRKVAPFVYLDSRMIVGWSFN